jgi:hypothetical protein
MARPLPKPTTPPTAAARRIVQSIKRLVEAEAESGDKLALRATDLAHIARASQAYIDLFLARANQEGVEGRISYREAQRRMGMAPGATQQRLDHGKELLAMLAAGEDPFADLWEDR